ncbi:conserved hypothetical protein [Hyella patelloides LEGE 07179]|uniref:Lipoprotein n=1 Tax=Hyella patelloides LEGE 07179 TaxID=945734 RepID=A0A563W1U2_9CYAN|nr:hypothetical protein [Hyella patelloides]VEP17636.1 conserved hypothetical protein [Hyella patelloides LEGE 07179]
MKLLPTVAIAFTTILASNLLVSCGGRAKMERCKFVEIEAAEFEVELGDLDAEGGEVEMVCGDKIVDVPWNQFKRELRIDPQRYANNLEGFKREVSCLINERSREKVVFCSRPEFGDEFVALKFNYDD